MSTLVRWNPAFEVDSFQTDMNRLFDGFFGTSARGGERRWVPAMDLGETETDIILTADLPGMKEDDITVEVKDGALIVAGERRDERTEERKGVHRAERSFGRFSRTLTLPRGIDAESVAATFEDGVLEVRVPQPEAPKAHRVKIGGRAHAPAIEGEASEREE